MASMGRLSVCASHTWASMRTVSGSPLRRLGASCALLGLEFLETPVSHFAAPLVEVMNGAGRGARGHIGLHVDDILTAERYFASHGLVVDESSRRLNPDGSTFLVYFAEEIAGFAIHLTRD